MGISALTISAVTLLASVDDARCAMVAKTATVLDVTLALDEVNPSVLDAGPWKARLFPTRLSLGLLRGAQFRLTISLGSLGIGCPEVPLATAPVALPDVRTHFNLTRPVELSLLAPWSGLLRRLGNDIDVHGAVSVSAGVSSTTSLGAPARPVAYRSAAPTIAPRLTPPTFSLPQPSFTTVRTPEVPAVDRRAR